MAMLALAVAAFPGRAIVATFDHGLREGSAGEARTVSEACARFDVAHTVLRPSETISGGSFQARARQARYGALVKWAAREDAGFLLTAHHADDQAETLLMRLNRASGVAGLAAIRPFRFDAGILILRPLLGWRRAELRAIADRCGLPVCDDPSNEDERYDRTRVRALLAANPALDPVALAASAAFLADAEDILRAAAETLWSERWRGPARGIEFDDQPRELRRRLVRRAILETREALGIIVPAFADAANVEPLLDAMESGRGAIQGGVKVGRAGSGWTFSPAPARRRN